MQANNTWWTGVSGPRRFVDAAVDAASAQKSVILSVPPDIPFAEEFIETLCSGLERAFSGRPVRFLAGSIEDPASYFFESTCLKKKRASFRPKPGYDKTRFLAETPESAMHGACFIAAASDDKTHSAWTEFISGYLSALDKSITPAVLILVTKANKIKPVKGVRIIRYDDYITHFDAYAYCAVRSSDIRENSVLKEYLAELASSVFSGNVERAEKAICIYREFLEDPLAFTFKHFEGIGISEKEIERRIWESQLKCIFPLLERYRCRFVSDCGKEISVHLPLPNPLGDDYEKAEDVELGALLYMSKAGMLLLERDKRDELSLFAGARNDLAHIETLSYEDLRRIASWQS